MGYQGLKWLGRVVDYSPSSGAEVENDWSYISAPPISLHGMDMDNFASFFNFLLLYWF